MSASSSVLTQASAISGPTDRTATASSASPRSFPLSLAVARSLYAPGGTGSNATRATPSGPAVETRARRVPRLDGGWIGADLKRGQVRVPHQPAQGVAPEPVVVAVLLAGAAGGEGPGPA